MAPTKGRTTLTTPGGLEAAAPWSHQGQRNPAEAPGRSLPSGCVGGPSPPGPERHKTLCHGAGDLVHPDFGGENVEEEAGALQPHCPGHLGAKRPQATRDNFIRPQHKDSRMQSASLRRTDHTGKSHSGARKRSRSVARCSMFNQKREI